MANSLKSFIEQSAEARRLEQDGKIFFHPRIPLSKLQGAIYGYMDGVRPEEILILVDNTVFGGAKEGIAITEIGVFFRSTPFDPIGYHVLNYVDTITCERGFFGTNLVINRSSKVSLDQAKRENVFALAQFLSGYIELRKKKKTSEKKSSRSTKKKEEDSTVEHDALDLVIPIIDVFLHFAFLKNNDFDEKNAKYILEFLSGILSTKEHILTLKSRVYLYPRPKLPTLIKNLDSLEPDQELKDLIVVGVFGLLKLNEFPRDLVGKHTLDVGTLLGMSTLEVAQAIKSAIEDDEEEMEDDHEEHVEWACKILEIKTNQINRDAVLKAYRLKMKDFHPDKYQSLPEPIMRMLHEKAQELNRAKDILSVLF